MNKAELDVTSLFTACDLKQFTFKSTASLPKLDSIIDQERALDAIKFGIGIQQEGFNLFILGPTRSGKRTIVTGFVEKRAQTEEVPPDWCYVDNYKDPHKPYALSLPPGIGLQFQQDMLKMVDELCRVVPQALESEGYLTHLEEIENTFKAKQDDAFGKLNSKANRNNISMLRTPRGFIFAPTKKGEVLQSDEFDNLKKAERKKIEQNVIALQDELEELILKSSKWRKDMQENVQILKRDVIMSAVGQLIDELRHSYSKMPAILKYLDAVQQDVIDHADQFRQEDEGMSILPGLALQGADQQSKFLNRYKVNLLVDNSKTSGAPVIYLDNPTYNNLVGRVEHQAQMGALITDFTMIKAGAFHQANGGYLILDIRKILLQPYSWEGLKRVLKSREIQIESLGQMLSVISTVSLEPQAIPLKVKVVLLGERQLYYLLCQYDPEFSELFKVAADFGDLINRSKDNNHKYALFIASIVREHQLRPLNVSAVGRLIEHSSRMVGDSEKVSSRFGKVADFLLEADYWAEQAKRKIITKDDVQRAIDASEQRLSRMRDRLQEETQRETLKISTDGSQIGQINGLSVLQLNEFAFGHPTRITARVWQGRGKVIDIEREVELGGPIHSKGVLILSGFLSGRYCAERSPSLTASLVFEQTYGGVDGDSASAAELFTLLSALSSVAIKQSIAVTGSVNQLGEVQAIGGVNEKIEGFFDVCKERGLTAEQGVIIPSSNVKHLMLKKEVTEAVAGGKFHIYAIGTIDEGIEILTGGIAGQRDQKGGYPHGSINYLVEERLAKMAQKESKEDNEDNNSK